MHVSCRAVRQLRIPFPVFCVRDIVASNTDILHIDFRVDNRRPSKRQGEPRLKSHFRNP